MLGELEMRSKMKKIFEALEALELEALELEGEDV